MMVSMGIKWKKVIRDHESRLGSAEGEGRGYSDSTPQTSSVVMCGALARHVFARFSRLSAGRASVAWDANEAPRDAPDDPRRERRLDVDDDESATWSAIVTPSASRRAAAVPCDLSSDRDRADLDSDRDTMEPKLLEAKLPALVACPEPCGPMTRRWCLRETDGSRHRRDCRVDIP